MLIDPVLNELKNLNEKIVELQSREFEWECLLSQQEGIVQKEKELQDLLESVRTKEEILHNIESFVYHATQLINMCSIHLQAINLLLKKEER